MKKCEKCGAYLCNNVKCTCSKYKYLAEDADGDLWGEGEMCAQSMEDVALKVAMKWNNDCSHVNDEIIIYVSNENYAVKFSVIPEPSIEYNINQV